MIELRTLGALELQGCDPQHIRALISQPKRLGLLAYLAIATPHGFHRRDSLLALLWPESDEEHARAALRNALSFLRRQLGEAVVVTRGDEVGLDLGTLWCDATAFEQLMGQGAAEEALGLYRGDLLSGFHVSDAPEFERWLEGERSRLRTQAAEAAWALSVVEERAGNWVTAAAHARRAVALALDYEQPARRLIELLDRAGDRAAALAEYEVLERRLAAELELRPSPETRALAEAIRARDQPRDAGVGAPVAIAPARAATDAIAVLDFVNLSGDPNLDWLSSGIAETVTVDLKKVPGVKIVSRDKVVRAQAVLGGGAFREADLARLGRDLGARWVLWGGFQISTRTVRITPQVRDTASDELVDAAKIDGSLDEIFTLQDQVVTRLIAALKLRVAEPHLVGIGKHDTRDIKAYECYARGRQAFNRFDPEGFAAAQRHYQAAIAVDPEYALAHAGLGSGFAFRYIATTDPADLARAIEHLERAIALDPNLAQPYGWLAYAYGRQERFHESRGASRRAIELDPDDTWAHYTLGAGYAAEAFTNRLPDLFTLAVEPLTRSIQLEPAYHAAYLVLGEVYMFLGLYGAARPLLDRAVRIEETGTFQQLRFVGALTLRGWLHLREHAPDAALELCRRSVDSLGRAPHVYGKQFSALAYCGMGEVEYGRAAYDRAVEHWSRARELAEQSSGKLGIGFVLVKALLGLARAFHRLSMRREETRHFGDATELMIERKGYDFHWMWEGSDAQASFDFSGYCAAAGRRRECFTWLHRAVAGGWRDRGLLFGNQDFVALEGAPEFAEVRRALEREPPASTLPAPSAAP